MWDLTRKETGSRSSTAFRRTRSSQVATLSLTGLGVVLHPQLPRAGFSAQGAECLSGETQRTRGSAPRSGRSEGRQWWPSRAPGRMFCSLFVFLDVFKLKWNSHNVK